MSLAALPLAPPPMGALWHVGGGCPIGQLGQAWWLAERVWHSQEVSRGSASDFVTFFKGTNGTAAFKKSPDVSHSSRNWPEAGQGSLARPGPQMSALCLIPMFYTRGHWLSVKGQIVNTSSVTGLHVSIGCSHGP